MLIKSEKQFLTIVFNTKPLFWITTCCIYISSKWNVIIHNASTIRSIKKCKKNYHQIMEFVSMLKKHDYHLSFQNTNYQINAASKSCLCIQLTL